MDLTTFPLLLTLAIVVTIVSALWLMIHARAVAVLFRRRHEVAPGPGARAPRGGVIAALVLFNLGWIAAVLIWVLADQAGNELVETEAGRAPAEEIR